MMCFLWRLVAIWIELWSLITCIHSQTDVGTSLLTPALEKAVAAWATGFDNPVFVFHGLDAVIPCSNKTDNKETSSTSIWLDDRDREVTVSRLLPSPSSHSLRATDVQLEDSGRYTCRFERQNITYWHHLIVYRMPTLKMEISFSYIMPTCREDRMKNRMDNFLPRFAVWPARRDEFRISRYSCVPISSRKVPTPEVLFTFVITHSLNDETTASLSICNAECMKVNVLNHLMTNQTLDLTERWLKMEKLNSTNHLFPDFRFEASQFNYKIVSDCDFGYELFQEIICLPCRPGTYYDKKNQTCSPCPKNFYQMRFAALHCNPCSLNGTTERNGTIWSSKCTPLNPMLRIVSLPYMVFIVVTVVIILVNIVIICVQTRESIKQCVRNLVQQKVPKQDVKVSSDETPLQVPIVGVPTAREKKSAAKDVALFEFQRKRGLVRVTSQESLSSFVMKRRLARTARNLEPRRIVKGMEIPLKPGLMNMYFEKYEPMTKSPSDDGLRSVHKFDAEADGALMGLPSAACPPGVCLIRGRPIKYPLPWSGFAAPTEASPPPPPPPPFDLPTVPVRQIVVMPNGELTEVPVGQMTAIPPTIWAVPQDTPATQPMLSSTLQPQYPTVIQTANVIEPQHLSAFHQALPTQVQPQQGTNIQSATAVATASQYQSPLPPILSTQAQPQQSTTIQSEAANTAVPQHRSAFQPVISSSTQNITKTQSASAFALSSHQSALSVAKDTASRQSLNPSAATLPREPGLPRAESSSALHRPT